MAKTLLEKALELPVHDRKREPVSNQEIELAIAWLKDEVSISNVRRVLGAKTSGLAMYKIARYLREAYRAGIIKVKV